MISFVYFLVVITLLVFFHELGHFTAARAFGVKVLTFSVGFGKPLLKYKSSKGTSFVFSIVPLGGYVKMLGDDKQTEDFNDPDAFLKQAPCKRLIIVLAGPLFNFFFALIVLWLMFQLGVYKVTPLIGGTEPNSLARKAGFLRYQTIVAVNDKKVDSWLAVQQEIGKFPKKNQLAITVKDADGHKSTKSLSLSNLNLNKEPLELKKIGLKAFSPNISPIIGEVIANSPAELSGLKKGDRIDSVNGNKILNWQELVTYVKQSQHSLLKINIYRDGKPRELIIDKPLKEQKLNKQTWSLGIISQKPIYPQNWYKKVQTGAFESISLAFNETVRLTSMTLSSIKKLLFGQVSMSNLAGPVGIAVGASSAMSDGVQHFLFFLAIVSVGLGVLNLLPIPILDGGQSLFIVFEMLFGRALPTHFREKGMLLGAIFLGALMIVAVKNDIQRLMHSESSYEVNRKRFNDK